MYSKNISNQTPQYRLSIQSGLLTGVAAGSATAGHVFAFRWQGTNLLALIQRIKLRWQTLTAFTAAQEIAFRLFRCTAYSAPHTGGTGVNLAAPNLKKETRFAASSLTDARIGNTGALTAGTHTLDAQELVGLNLWSQQGAAPNVLGGETEIYPPWPDYPLFVLTQDEGFIVRNEIAMGAAGVGRLLVECDWVEVPR